MNSDMEMTADETAVSLRNLSFGFGRSSKSTVLGSRIDASLKYGELACVVGPVGGGKSLLAKTVAGLQPCFDGDVFLGRRRVGDCSKAELSRHVAYFSSESASICNISVADYIVYGHKPVWPFRRKMSEKDSNAVSRCLDWLGIGDFSNRKIRTLSRAERDKVILAKAIFSDVPVIFLDGLLDSLSFPDNVEVLCLLRRMAHTSKKAVAVLMGNAALAMQFADRIWSVDKNRGFNSGIPEDLFLRGVVDECFGNERISYDISTGRFVFSGDHIRSVIVEGDVAGKEYTAVCRALGRCAVDVVTPEAASGSSVLKVVVKGNGRFCLHHPDASEENFMSVEHLLTALLSAMSKLRISLLSEESPEP